MLFRTLDFIFWTLFSAVDLCVMVAGYVVALFVDRNE